MASMKKLLMSLLALGAVLGVARPSQAWTGFSQPFSPITMIFLRDWTTTSARYMVQLANIPDVCGAGTSWAYFDAQTPNSSEMYSLLNAAFLSGRLVSLQLSSNTSTCKIIGVQVQN